MKFSTDESDQDIIKVALFWLDRGFRPCVIYPRDYPKPAKDKDGNAITIPASGKEPFGFKWGARNVTSTTLKKNIEYFHGSGMTPGLGLCLGPGRAPGGLGLMDIEGDGPEAEGSRTRLFNGEIISTIGHASTRGDHQFFSYDWSRLQPILAQLSRYQTKTQPGVYHLPQLPGLELRVGGKNDKGELKQLQSVIPPTPGTDGVARTSNGVEILAPVPESFYLFLEHVTQEIVVPPAPGGANGYHDDDQEEIPDPLASDVPETEKTKPKRGRPKGSGVGTSIEGWLRKQFKGKLDSIASAAQGERHPLVMTQVKWLAGFLHYGCGFTRAELELAGIEAANQAAPERAGDNPRCVKEAIRYGSTLPLELPANLHDKYTKFKQAVEPVLPKPSTNGDGPGHREPGDDDPEALASAHAGHNLTDLGNSRRLVDMHGIDIYYISQWDSWYVWADNCWARDHVGKVNYYCEDVPPLLLREAAILGPDDGQDTLAWAHKSESKERLNAMEIISQNNPVVATVPEKFDQNPWQFNCPNGTIDLKTCKLGPHVRSDMITKICQTDYDPAALCPIWDQFLNTIFDNKTYLIDYVQRLAGYSIVGITTEEILIFLSGVGANGKTTLLETISDVIGDYACACVPQILIETKFGDSNNLPLIAKLFGKRFVSVREMDGNVRIAEGMMKHITGGDTITGRFLYGHPFDFKPTHTIWLASNTNPDIKGREEGIWRRIKRIPFDVVIPKAQRDKNLKEKLLAERSGILRWIIDGAARWLASGLIEPQDVIDATQEYMIETDVYAPFFEDCCTHNPNYKCVQNDLLDAFDYWASVNHVRRINKKRFGQVLKERHYVQDRDKMARYVIGIQVKEECKRPLNHWRDQERDRDYQPLE